MPHPSREEGCILYIFPHTNIVIYKSLYEESKLYIGWIKIHETHMTANKAINNNVFFLVSDLKIVSFNNY